MNPAALICLIATLASAEDIDSLARMVASECENQPLLAQLGCLQVALHRYEQGWAPTLHDVVTDMRHARQFYINASLREDSLSYAKAYTLVENNFRWPMPDVTNEAMYFTSNDNPPCRRCVMVNQIEDIRFWR